MPKNTILEKLNSETVILATISFIGSLASFAFEVGHLNFYDVPYDVINLGFYRILTTTLWLSMAFAIFWFFISKAIAMTTSRNPIIKNIPICIALISIIIFTIKNIKIDEAFWGAIWGPIFFILTQAFSWGVTKIGILRGKIPDNVIESIEDGIKDGEAMAERSKKMSEIYLTPFILIAFLLFMVSTLGYWIAKITSTHWILDDQPTFILVRKYDQTYIFKEYNQKTQNLGDRVLIVNHDDKKMLILKRTKITLRTPTM